MNTTVNSTSSERKLSGATLSRQPEDKVTRTIEMATSNIPSVAFLGLAGASIVASLSLKFLFGRSKDALFVGQWAPTFLLLGVYNKIVKEERGLIGQ